MCVCVCTPQEIALKIVIAAVGPVTDYEVQVAAIAGAKIYTFNTKPPGASVNKVIKSLNVEVCSLFSWFFFL